MTDTTDQQRAEFERSTAHRRLGDKLLDDGLVSPEELEAALAEQRLSGGRLGDILVSRGIVEASSLARELALTTGLEFRDLTVDLPDPAVTRRFPLAFCRRRLVLPLEERGGELIVGIADPHDVEVLDDLRNISDVPVRPVVVVPRQLRRALEDAFSGDPFSVQAGTAEAGGPPPPRDDAMDEDMTAAYAQAPVVQFVHQLLLRAVNERCSDVHFEPSEEGLRIRFRIDGILGDAGYAPPGLRSGIISRLKIMAGMDISEHRRPQDGRLSFDADGRKVDIRMASLPTAMGEALVLRLLDKDQGLLALENLGFRPEALKRYEAAFRMPWGLILVSGPTGSGKSTTLYATLNALNDETRNTITVEDPIEYMLRGIKQTQINPRIGYDFALGLRAALRADPDIILIGEIRDVETARISSDAAMTGHLVFSTIHANDAASSTTRLIDMGLEPYRVISALVCVVAQRLVRRLCLRCRTEYVLTEPERQQILDSGLEIGELVTLYRPRGCAACNNTGYFGRIAVQEVMVMNRQLEDLVLERAAPDVIAEAAVASGMETLAQDALAKVLVGDTSLDELFRVVI